MSTLLVLTLHLVDTWVTLEGSFDRPITGVGGLGDTTLFGFNSFLVVFRMVFETDC